MKKYLFILSVLVIGLASCSKDKTTPQPVVDPAVQAKVDDDAIVAYLDAHPNIMAVKDASNNGLYYQIIDAGSGAAITASSKLVVSYLGTDLKDVQFDKNDNFAFSLSQNIIAGWQLGVPKIKNGGKILLFIPSALGYGPYANGALPANSVLVFTITIKSVDGVAPVID
ncbi:MAG: FKBP-type peptidyl-prolyl cis-trans isomerase [Mucilaginibacter sp.]|jgi:FKBP-type peptidyl-prolyl cis-trans isomerase|uniref:FKBP-type peptidyl-prolyl cis-trans isomerase n=1 Tax=Mucilaginibacter sp. TaxID=1882438 RepID=UPI0035640A14